MKNRDRTEIPLEKNIRSLLKNTIFAHPDDIQEAIKATSIISKKKKK